MGPGWPLARACSALVGPQTPLNPQPCRASTTKGTTYDIVLVDDVPNLGCLGIEVAEGAKADLPRLQSIKISASGAAPVAIWQPAPP